MESGLRGSSRCTVIVVEVGGVFGDCCRPGVGELPGFKQSLRADAFGAFPARGDELCRRRRGKCLEEAVSRGELLPLRFLKEGG